MVYIYVVLVCIVKKKGRIGSKFMPLAAAIILQKMPRFSWGFNPEFREVGHATMSEAISLGRKILPQNDD